jgi:hypothetical protein
MALRLRNQINEREIIGVRVRLRKILTPSPQSFFFANLAKMRGRKDISLHSIYQFQG